MRALSHVVWWTLAFFNIGFALYARNILSIINWAAAGFILGISVCSIVQDLTEVK